MLLQCMFVKGKKIHFLCNREIEMAARGTTRVRGQFGRESRQAGSGFRKGGSHGKTIENQSAGALWKHVEGRLANRSSGSGGRERGAGRAGGARLAPAALVAAPPERDVRAIHRCARYRNRSACRRTRAASSVVRFDNRDSIHGAPPRSSLARSPSSSSAFAIRASSRTELSIRGCSSVWRSVRLVSHACCRLAAAASSCRFSIRTPPQGVQGGRDVQV